MIYAENKAPAAGFEAEERKLKDALAPIIAGLGLALVDVRIVRHRGSTDVKIVVFKRAGTGVDDCARAHRAIMPRLALAFGEENFSCEVSSPGINRLIKYGAEFGHFIDCPVKCWDTTISDWKRGSIQEVTDSYIVINGEDGMEKLDYAVIAKAKLDLEAPVSETKAAL